MTNLPTRIDKTIAWLETSRDVWKEKAKEAKNELKKKKQAVKRNLAIRDSLEKALEDEKQARLEKEEALLRKEREVDELQKELARLRGECESLKKKL